MAEMAPSQVKAYGKLIKETMGDTGVLFEINNDAAHCNYSVTTELLRNIIPFYGRLTDTHQYFEFASGNIWAAKKELLQGFNVEQV